MSGDRENLILAASLIGDAQQIYSWYYLDSWECERFQLPILLGSIASDSYYILKEANYIINIENVTWDVSYIEKCYEKYLESKNAGINTIS